MEILESLHQSDGFDTFIHSSESIFGQAKNAHAFFEELNSRIPTLIVAYFRDPHSWLPSAYTQWGLRHKTVQGPIVPYTEMAPKLLRQYSSARIWEENFGRIFRARIYSKKIDIVSDFSDAVGVKIVPPKTRSLERGEHADALLRALFNNRLAGDAKPELFNKTVLNSDKIIPRSIADFSNEIFDFSQTSNIVSDNKTLIKNLRNILGDDFLRDPAPSEMAIDHAALKDRLIDYLVEIVLQQSIRISNIEDALVELRSSNRKWHEGLWGKLAFYRKSRNSIRAKRFRQS